MFRNYTDALPGCVAAAKAAGAQRIIALTHIGFDEDKQLAADAAAAGVDLIVGACRCRCMPCSMPWRCSKWLGRLAQGARPEPHLPRRPAGGHSHTLLYGPPAPAGEPQVGQQPPPILVSPPANETAEAEGPYPTLVKAADGSTVPIVQAMWGSR